jgi:hypothetical protein
VLCRRSRRVLPNRCKSLLEMDGNPIKASCSDVQYGGTVNNIRIAMAMAGRSQLNQTINTDVNTDVNTAVVSADWTTLLQFARCPCLYYAFGKVR